MSEAAATRWLAERPAVAPPLQQRLLDAAAAAPADAAASDALAAAAVATMRRALDAMRERRDAERDADGLRPAAADLLVADALLTHAVAAAAEEGRDAAAIRARVGSELRNAVANAEPAS